jgi:hypothetical protein
VLVSFTLSHLFLIIQWLTLSLVHTLQVGVECELVDAAIGEFDQDLLGLPSLGEKITMFESLGSGYGFEHKITNGLMKKCYVMLQEDLWIFLYMLDNVDNQLPLTRNDVKWEPFIEFWMRKSLCWN